MLDKKIFINGINDLLIAFPSWNFDAENKSALSFWYERFKHMDKERFGYMIKSYTDHETRFPTIAGLKKCDTIPRKSRDQIQHEQMLKEMGM